MSHSVHPYSHRLGILRDWKSRWFGRGGSYQEYLRVDVLLREYLEKKLRGLYVNSIEMERGENSFRIIIKTARPGMVIGRSGEGAKKLRADVLKQMRKLGVEAPRDFKIDIEEVRDPETHAAVVGQMIAEGLEKRLPFRRVMKQTVEKVMANRGVQGVRINLSGRLGGAEMGRKEYLKEGRIPLQTLRADIDFAKEKAHLPYGDIGIKVWIYRGDIFEKRKKN
ncbi:30S ribosomal protein S3 [bacterium]|nr:30S ribosomal protein S3 [bacterium]|tara:strand:+ start:9021 stop:9689 length:669 start_codon:yes stop_codon:yes gene_type:complete